MLAVGDSIDHEILGAHRAGIRSVLVTGGVHASALGVTWGKLPAAETWRGFAANAIVTPDYLLPVFVW